MKIKDIFEYRVEGAEAWDQGYDAFGKGTHKNDNPYNPGTNEYSDWLDGWNARARDKAS